MACSSCAKKQQLAGYQRVAPPPPEPGECIYTLDQLQTKSSQLTSLINSLTRDNNPGYYDSIIYNLAIVNSAINQYSKDCSKYNSVLINIL